MKLWTFQSKKVLDIIEKQGYYEPDFNKSDYLKIKPELGDLYYFILGSYNKNNNTNAKGLVFSFLKQDPDMIRSIRNIDEFCGFIQRHSQVFGSLIDKIRTPDRVILELDYAEDFNPIFVDMNDFQFLMPPIMVLPPYTNYSKDRICSGISEGVMYVSEMPSGVVQGHTRIIKSENLTNVYDLSWDTMPRQNNSFTGYDNDLLNELERSGILDIVTEDEDLPF